MGRPARLARAVLAAAAVLAVGCADARTELLPFDAGVDAPADAAPEAGPPPITQSRRVDLLLVVDNSPNTQAFQALFAATEGYLLGRFAQPACVNGLGNVVQVTQSPTDPCSVGQREFPPIDDVHVGVVTTSIGGHGADFCSPASPSWDPTQDDAGHLITRGPGGAVVPTYQNLGFLAWDPKQEDTPPGEADLGVLTDALGEVTTAAGSNGCAFESHLESFYRFLVDPEPYATIPVVNGQATPTGIDETLLQQRADFLRPDSALVIVLITDEDDCSTREGSQYYLSDQVLDTGNPGQLFHLPPPRSACAVNPNGACCASCGEPDPPGCVPAAEDPACQTATLSDAEDPFSLRCFDQKRRFGIDFLYPVQRYVDGLTQPMVAARDGSMVPNPIFAGDRSPELVMMAGIVGVPWQDVAVSPHTLASGYAPADQIDWSLVLGDPTTGTPPGDPLMIKSVAPRTGDEPAHRVPARPAVVAPDGQPHQRPRARHPQRRRPPVRLHLPPPHPDRVHHDVLQLRGPGHPDEPRLPGPRRHVRIHRALRPRPSEHTGPPGPRGAGEPGDGRLGVRGRDDGPGVGDLRVQAGGGRDPEDAAAPGAMRRAVLPRRHPNRARSELPFTAARGGSGGRRYAQRPSYEAATPASSASLPSAARSGAVRLAFVERLARGGVSAPRLSGTRSRRSRTASSSGGPASAPCPARGPPPRRCRGGG